VLAWLERPDEIHRRVAAAIEQIRARALRNVPEAVRLIASRPRKQSGGCRMPAERHADGAAN
jgi:hypothetical protein